MRRRPIQMRLTVPVPSLRSASNHEELDAVTEVTVPRSVTFWRTWHSLRGTAPAFRAWSVRSSFSRCSAVEMKRGNGSPSDLHLASG